MHYYGSPIEIKRAEHVFNSFILYISNKCTTKCIWNNYMKSTIYTYKPETTDQIIHCFMNKPEFLSAVWELLKGVQISHNPSLLKSKIIHEPSIRAARLQALFPPKVEKRLVIFKLSEDRLPHSTTLFPELFDGCQYSFQNGF